MPLVILLVVVALAVLAGALMFWPRLPGPRALQRVLRGLLVVTNQLAAVMLVLVLANDAGGFYPSWSSLLPATGPLPLIHPARADHAQPSTDVGTRRDIGSSTQRDWAHVGRLESVTISGPASQLHVHAYIYLPPQYFQPSYAHQRFSAVELLAGYPASAAVFLHPVNAAALLLAQMRAAHIPPLALIMLDSRLAKARDTECTDVPAGPQAETFFATDVPLAISREFRIRPTKWGAAGSGAGGYCAAKLSVEHADVFPVGASSAGYFDAVRTRFTGDLWAGSVVLRRQNDLYWRLRHLPAPPARLLLLADSRPGSPDARAAVRFHALARHPVDVTIQLIGALANDPLSKALAPMLAWVGHRLPAPS